MNLSDTERLELAWLARQQRPMWGGHIERDEPLPYDSPLRRYLDLGLIERHQVMRQRQTIKGYRITNKGRALIKSAENTTVNRSE